MPDKKKTTKKTTGKDASKSPAGSNANGTASSEGRPAHASSGGDQRNTSSQQNGAQESQNGGSNNQSSINISDRGLRRYSQFVNLLGVGGSHLQPTVVRLSDNTVIASAATTFEGSDSDSDGDAAAVQHCHASNQETTECAQSDSSDGSSKDSLDDDEEYEFHFNPENDDDRAHIEAAQHTLSTSFGIRGSDDHSRIAITGSVYRGIVNQHYPPQGASSAEREQFEERRREFQDRRTHHGNREDPNSPYYRDPSSEDSDNPNSPANLRRGSSSRM